MKTAKLDYTNSGILIIGLLMLSIVAFWQSYYIVFFTSEVYVHFHAFTAILWFALLIVQPYLIKKRKVNLHRMLGKISYPVAGLVVISILLLAHNRISTAPESIIDDRLSVHQNRIDNIIECELNFLPMLAEKENLTNIQPGDSNDYIQIM